MVFAIMVAAAAITSLEPTSKWYVDYATDACTVGRAFGPPEKPIVLGIVADAMGHGVDFELVDSRVSGTVEQREFQVQFAPNALPFAVDGRTFPVGPKDVQKLTFHLNDDGMRRLGGATRIAIVVKRNLLVALDLPGLAPAMAALEKCRVDLVSSWGMNPVEQARLKVPPKLISGLAKGPIFTNDDYPTQALRERQSGTASVRLKVEADGQPSDCAVTRSSGSVALDTATCRVIQERAHYAPALDTEGKPMASIETVKIKWKIPQ